MRDFKVLTSEEFVSGLLLPDQGFDISDGFLNIRWGGYEYQIRMDEIRRPEDVLWWLMHLGRKDWDGMTPLAVTRLIVAIAKDRGWKVYRNTPHPNEAPKPNHDKIAERGKMTAKVRYEVIKRDGYRCRACGFAVQDGAHLHVDHIVAIANGGETEEANLQTLCTVCNIGKGAS